MLKFLTILLFPMLAMGYETGRDFCKKNPVNGFSRFHETEKNVIIHSYVKKKFDPAKPVILFFTGGPGSSPRSSEFDLPDYNIIFFEQRGMGCSRPQNARTFLNPDFYSSRKSVNDARKVLEDYGVKKAIIYGHSYGTILGTIFASLHPEMTEKLILEGIIYKGDIGIWKSEIKRRKLQETFDSLSHDQQERIISLSDSGKLPATWFSVVGTMMSYLDNGSILYRDFLKNVLPMDDENLIPFIHTFYMQKGFKDISPLHSNDGEVVFGMLTCKELSGLEDFSDSSLYFDKDRKLIWTTESDFKSRYCNPLGVQKKETIDLTNFPVKVPVIYLEGEFDGATDLTQAKLHARYVSKSKKTFYMLSKGGHLPNLGPLKENRACRDEDDCRSLKPVKTQVKFFESILQDRLDEKELKQLNKNLEFEWVKLAV